MRRLARRALMGMVAILSIASLMGAAYEVRSTSRELRATPPPGKLVDIGGYRLHIWCTGSGEPAVVLDTGLGAPRLTGAPCNRRSRSLRAYARTTEPAWVTATQGQVPARRSR